MDVDPPPPGTEAHTWFSRGAHAEARARKDGRSEAGLRVRSYVDGVAKNRHEMSEADIAALTFSIYVLAPRSLRQRISLAMRVIKPGPWTDLRS